MMRTGFLMGVVLLVAGCRADAGEKVLVKLADKKYSAVAGPDGRMKTNECDRFCPVCYRAIERMIAYYTTKNQ